MTAAARATTVALRGLAAGALVLGLLAAAARADDGARGLLDKVKQLNDTTRKWTDRQ